MGWETELQETEKAHRDATVELERMRQEIERMEGERAAMIQEVEAQIERALASMAFSETESDIGGSGSRSSSRPSARRATTSSSVPDKDKPRPSPRESILRFDDMLMGHIASEREAIKRITDNISSMSNSEAGTSFLPL